MSNVFVGPKGSSSTYFPWKCLRRSDFAFHCVSCVGGGGPNSRQDTGDDSDSFHGKLDVAVVAAWVGAALEVAPWCWTQSTVFLPTLFGIGLDVSLRRRLLELGDLAL